MCGSEVRRHQTVEALNRGSSELQLKATGNLDLALISFVTSLTRCASTIEIESDVH